VPNSTIATTTGHNSSASKLNILYDIHSDSWDVSFHDSEDLLRHEDLGKSMIPSEATLRLVLFLDINTY